MAEWFADEDFWRAIYPFEFPPPVIDAGVAQVDRVLALTGVAGGPVLDVGCGPGRHAVPLARRGFAVTAVDLSAFHLERARAYAERVGVTVELLLADMRVFARPAAFDLAVSIFTSFGYFDDPEDDRRVLERVRESLRPGGVLLMDLASKERLARVLHPTLSERSADGGLLVQRHEIVDDWTRVRNEWTVVQGERARTWRFHLRIYSGQELRTLLAAAGFASIRLHGALDGRPYDRRAERLVAVART